jgi:hypothetical protein
MMMEVSHNVLVFTVSAIVFADSQQHCVCGYGGDHTERDAGEKMVEHRSLGGGMNWHNYIIANPVFWLLLMNMNFLSMIVLDGDKIMALIGSSACCTGFFSFN